MLQYWQTGSLPRVCDPSLPIVTRSEDRIADVMRSQELEPPARTWNSQRHRLGTDSITNPENYHGTGHDPPDPGPME